MRSSTKRIALPEYPSQERSWFQMPPRWQSDVFLALEATYNEVFCLRGTVVEPTRAQRPTPLHRTKNSVALILPLCGGGKGKAPVIGFPLAQHTCRTLLTLWTLQVSSTISNVL